MSSVLAEIKKGKVTRVLRPGKPIRVGGISHPANIRDLWSDAELKKIGLRRVDEEPQPDYDERTHRVERVPVEPGGESTTDGWKVIKLTETEQEARAKGARLDGYRQAFGSPENMIAQILGALEELHATGVDLGGGMKDWLNEKKRVDKEFPIK